jgi:transposase InsO family protein
VTFGFIAVEKAQYSVRRLCAALGVSPSGFYAWQQRGPAARQLQDQLLTRQLRLVHADSRGTYGRPRLQRALVRRGYRLSEKRVARLMRQAQLVARGRRRARRTTVADPDAKAANTLGRSFFVTAPNTVWAADITALWTAEGWHYLAVLLDLASRRVVGWAMRETLDSQLVLAALERALATRRPAPGLLHHSDRGVQYTSAAYGARLAAAGIRISMSRVGNCWDNAPVESFFSSLKAEALPARPWSTRAQARIAIADHLQFYNERRLHSSLAYRTPVEHEVNWCATV